MMTKNHQQTNLLVTWKYTFREVFRKETHHTTPYAIHIQFHLGLIRSPFVSYKSRK